MVASLECRICGNEVVAGVLACPFCGHKHHERFTGLPAACRTVNLEKGMPTVKQAMQKLDIELSVTPPGEAKALVLIHGYGSSGRGGAIRKEVRRQLFYLAEGGKIREVLCGEDIHRRSGRCRQLARQYPCLTPYLRRSNPGITLIVV